MDILEGFIKKRIDIGILILRCFVGFRLIYGVLDNIISWDHMIAFTQFLDHHGFIFPSTMAFLSVYTQFICGILVLLGYYTRTAGLILTFNFLIALVFVHLQSGDSIEAMTPAMAMLFGSLTLVFTGADRISLDFKMRQ